MVCNNGEIHGAQYMGQKVQREQAHRQSMLLTGHHVDTVCASLHSAAHMAVMLSTAFTVIFPVQQRRRSIRASMHVMCGLCAACAPKGGVAK